MDKWDEDWSEVSTHSHPKVAATGGVMRATGHTAFQHTATRRWLRLIEYVQSWAVEFQHTATRRWLPLANVKSKQNGIVSTHSHPKVAAKSGDILFLSGFSFNTQPPEGGCYAHFGADGLAKLFQHTATRRWLPKNNGSVLFFSLVSTHSHPKVAAKDTDEDNLDAVVSTHSHPKVAASQMSSHVQAGDVSTHSHPKVAADYNGTYSSQRQVSTHSHPKVAA